MDLRRQVFSRLIFGLDPLEGRRERLDIAVPLNAAELSLESLLGDLCSQIGRLRLLFFNRIGEDPSDYSVGRS